MKCITNLVFAGALACLLAGCASEKNKTVSQRGWIGGDYVLAQRETAWRRLGNSPGVSGTLPKSVPSAQRAAIEITGLATNTPAGAAGLRKGDFVLELNHRPMTSLQAFRRTIDRSAPGTWLAVKAYRDGQSTEYQVPMGREKYKNGGYFSVVLPTVVHRWDLWPDPGFSLVCVGYEPNPGLRHELGKTHEVYDENWSAYVGFMEFSCGKRVMAQEPVAADKME
jgi:hypothetical protein